MKPVIHLIVILILMPVMACVAFAGGISVYSFDSDEQREQFHQITQELRCPKCQNQSVGDSDAPIANDIRDRVYEKLVAGESQEEIIKYMTDRYGQFVTYRPPVSLATAVLWFGPPLLVLIVLVLVIRQTARRQNLDGLDNAEQAIVEKILHDYGSNSLDAKQMPRGERD